MKKSSESFKIADATVGKNHPSYFIADIGANHDGCLEKAKELIHMAKEAGADAAKFQHFKAETIVSDYGFKNLGDQQSHQAKWKKSVFEVYKDASLNVDWTPTLKAYCDEVGITFFTSPYSYDLVDQVDEFLPAYKIGSGDITWTGIIEHICSKNKPVLLATGASSMDDVDRAMKTIMTHTADVVLMQCNTNYTADLENFKYINLNVLKAFAEKYPDTILGLSDHTPGHATVLGSIALGARVIEKHFTDSNDNEGPDHKFAMNPTSWREMVDRSRELEFALGDGLKRVEENEKQTVVLQRRSLRTTKELQAGHTITADDIEALRPCPEDALEPFAATEVIGKTIATKLDKGQHFSKSTFK